MSSREDAVRDELEKLSSEELAGLGLQNPATAGWELIHDTGEVDGDLFTNVYGHEDHFFAVTMRIWREGDGHYKYAFVDLAEVFPRTRMFERTEYSRTPPDRGSPDTAAAMDGPRRRIAGWVDLDYGTVRLEWVDDAFVLWEVGSTLRAIGRRFYDEIFERRDAMAPASRDLGMAKLLAETSRALAEAMLCEPPAELMHRIKDALDDELSGSCFVASGNHRQGYGIDYVGEDPRSATAGTRVARILDDLFIEGTVVAVDTFAGGARLAIVWDGAHVDGVEGSDVVRISWIDEPARRTFGAGEGFEVLQ